MIERDIVSVPIRIKLINTDRIDTADEYPQIMIEPSPCHYPHLIDSAMDPQKNSLISSADTENGPYLSDDESCTWMFFFFPCCR